jgi:hypothetical protein
MGLLRPELREKKVNLEPYQKDEVIGVLKKLKNFEENNNLVPLYLLNTFHYGSFFEETKGNDVFIMKNGYDNPKLKELELNKKTIDKALDELTSSMLLFHTKEGDFIVGEMVRFASTAIEIDDLKFSDQYLPAHNRVKLGDNLKQHGISLDIPQFRRR